MDATVRYGKSVLELHERLGDRRNTIAMHAHIDTTYMAGWVRPEAHRIEGSASTRTY